jgi:hypothetical protein
MTDFDNQGKLFIRFRNKYKNLIKKKNVSNIGIVEGMEGDLSLDDVNQIEKLQLKKLENEFNRDLALYSRKYKVYLNSLLGRQRGSNNYANKIVKYKGDKYFVQQNGKLRKFSDEAWTNKGSGCGEATPISDETFAKLTVNGSGAIMGPNEKCKSGGYSAKMLDGDAYAWIDPNGYKNIYEDSGNIHSSCPKNFHGLTKQQFDAIPNSGSTMTYSSICDRGSLDSPLHEQLKILNNRLINKSEKMKTIINKLKMKDKEIETNVDEQRSKLMEKSKELNKRRKIVIKAEQEAQTLRGDLNNKILRSDSINLQNMIWVAAGITFFIVAANKLSTT